MKKFTYAVIVFTLVFALMTPAFAADFMDVSDDAWYGHVVRCAEDIGMVQGDGNGNLYPEADVTMTQFVTMLGRAFGGVVGDSYEPYIAWASDYFDSFDADATITVEQLAVLVDTFMQNSGIEPIYYWQDSVYVDGADVSDSAKSSVDKLVNYGFIHIGTDSKIHPQKTVTRAECMMTLVFYYMSLNPVNSVYSYVEGY